MRTKPLLGKKVCIIHPGDPSFDFRLKKTIKMLADSGAEVYVLAYLSCVSGDIKEWEGCTSLCRFRPYTTLQASKNKIWLFRVLWNLTVLRVQSLLDKGVGRCGGLANTAADLDVDWYHCINVDGAEEFLKLAKKTGRPIIYESYEYFPEDLKDGAYPFAENNKKLYEIEKKLVSKYASATIVVGEEIAQGYQRHYGGPAPTVIHNVAEDLVQAIKKTGDSVRFYFHSYLRPAYNIERLIDAFGQTSGAATLTIQGATFDEEYRNTISSRIAASERSGDIELLDPCEHDRVIEVTHEYDVGIISISALINNRVVQAIRLALQNKLFTYASAGLAMAITDYPAQNRILKGFGAARTFAPDSLEEMASTLQYFIDNRDLIDNMKKESLRFARLYSFDAESAKLVSVCLKILGSESEE